MALYEVREAALERNVQAAMLLSVADDTPPPPHICYTRNDGSAGRNTGDLFYNNISQVTSYISLRNNKNCRQKTTE